MYGICVDSIRSVWAVGFGWFEIGLWPIFQVTPDSVFGGGCMRVRVLFAFMFVFNLLNILFFARPTERYRAVKWNRDVEMTSIFPVVDRRQPIYRLSEI